ncbi:MAG TPA: type IV pilin-like G/H family protein [Phormidium sp.]
MTVKKMSTDIDKTSKKIRFLVSSLLVRSLIYSGFFAGILASFYNFKLNTIVMPTNSALPQVVKEDIISINEAQQAYYAKNNKFSDSLEGLGVKLRSTNNYKYKILSSSMNPVQILENKRESAQVESATVVIAIPRFEEGEGTMYAAVYTAAVFAFKKNVSNQLTTISVICQENPYSSDQIQPTFDGTKTDCPPNTTILR